MDDNPIVIRQFSSADRQAVRMISCETAFLGEPWEQFFEDGEVLADALTMYYTDYEPDSCFVAVSEGRVIGYIVGTVDIDKMNRIFRAELIPRLIAKALRRGVFLKGKTQKFIIHIMFSFLKGEFLAPDFSKRYPATLHVNIDKAFRRRAIGRQLVEYYLEFLRRKKLRGIHFGTMSESAKGFFTSLGFAILFVGKRSYLRYYLDKNAPYYILGKVLNNKMN